MKKDTVNVIREFLEFRQFHQIDNERTFFKNLQQIYSQAKYKQDQLIMDMYKTAEDSNGVLDRNELYKYGRADKYKQELTNIHKELGKQESSLMEESLLAAVGLGFAFNTFLFDTLGANVQAEDLEKEKAKEIVKDNWSGKTLNEMVAKDKANTVDRVFNGLLTGIAINQTMKDSLSLSKFSLESGVKKSMLNFQTEQTKKISDVDQYAFKKFEKPLEKVGLKQQHQWVAVLDDRTCPECSKLDGLVFDIDKIKQPPLHPRCRCFLALYFPEDTTTVRRARDPETGKNYLTNHRYFNEWAEEKGLTARVKPNRSVTSLTPMEMTSISEANRWAVQNLKNVSVVDYKGFDVEVANRVNVTLNKLQTKFPEVQLSLVGDYNGLVRQFPNEVRGKVRDVVKEHKNAFGFASTYKNKPMIVLNNQYSKNPSELKKSIEAHRKEGYYVPSNADPVEAIMTHEYGHTMDKYLKAQGIDFNKSSIIDEYQEEMDNYISKHSKVVIPKGLSREETKGLRREQNKERQELTKKFNQENLSIYGSSKISEFFAEAFTEYQTAKNPRPYAVKVGKWVEEQFDTLRKGK